MLVRPIRAHDVDPLAELLAKTFTSDPVYAYLFPAMQQRGRGLRDFFARNLRVHLPYRCTHAAFTSDGVLVGTVTVRPPAGFSISPLRLARHLLPFALKRGIVVARRVLWVKKTYEAMEAMTAAGSLVADGKARRVPHAYVHMMAIAPSEQGRGYGRRLLQAVLSDVEVSCGSAPTVLSTHREQNVAFYQRDGFVVTSDQTIAPPDAEPYRVWNMRRDGRR